MTITVEKGAAGWTASATYRGKKYVGGGRGMVAAVRHLHAQLPASAKPGEPPKRCSAVWSGDNHARCTARGEHMAHSAMSEGYGAVVWST